MMQNLRVAMFEEVTLIQALTQTAPQSEVPNFYRQSQVFTH